MKRLSLLEKTASASQVFYYFPHHQPRPPNALLHFKRVLLHLRCPNNPPTSSDAEWLVSVPTNHTMRPPTKQKRKREDTRCFCASKLMVWRALSAKLLCFHCSYGLLYHTRRQALLGRWEKDVINNIDELFCSFRVRKLFFWSNSRWFVSFCINWA
jgi:hypothetical protein